MPPCHLRQGSEALPALPKTRLVVLGKPADRASLQKAWPAYAQSFVTKPVKPSVLIERILTQLARLDAAPADAEAAAAAARAGAEEAPEAPWCIPVGDASTAAVAVGAPTVLRQTDGEVAGKARPRKSPPLRLVTEVRAEAPLAAAAVQVDRTPRLSKGSIGTESPVPPQEHWGGQPVAGRRVSDVLRRRSAELTRPAAPASRLSGGLAGGRPARLQSMTGVPSPGAGAEPPSGPTPGSGGVRLGGFREFALGSEEAIAGLLTERGGSCHSGGPPGAAGGDGPGAGSTPRAGAAKGSSGGELRRGDSTRSDDEPWPGGDLLGGAAEQDNTPAGRALLAEQARAALTALRPVRRRESIETSEKAAERWRAEKKEAARAGGAMHRGSSAGFLSVKCAVFLGPPCFPQPCNPSPCTPESRLVFPTPPGYLFCCSSAPGRPGQIATPGVRRRGRGPVMRLRTRRRALAVRASRPQRGRAFPGRCRAISQTPRRPATAGASA